MPDNTEKKYPRIFCADLKINNNNFIINNHEKYNYITKVLRKKITDYLIIFADNNYEYLMQITKIHKNTIELLLINKKYSNNESSLAIHLGIAITKPISFDLILQKATELGVTTITPLITNRVQNNLIPNDKKFTRWNNIIISATEQCERNKLCKLNPYETLSDWLKTNNTTDTNNIVLSPETNNVINKTNINLKKLNLLIGPEGGFTSPELELIKNNNFIAVSLGPRILRTETASIAILSILEYVNATE